MTNYPMKFVGSGFTPGEIVTIDLVVGVEVGQALPTIPDDGIVGLANPTANDFGAFSTGMEYTGLIMTFLGAIMDLAYGYINTEGATPIPAGLYTVVATGTISGVMASDTLEFAPPAA